MGEPSLAYIVVDYDYMKEMQQGVAVKVDAQIKAFRAAGINAMIVSVDTPKDALSKLKKRLPFCRDVIAWEDVASKIAGCDYVYIRRPQTVTKEFLRALRMWRRSNPNMKVIYEVPTYPYDAEDKTLKKWPLHVKDLWHRRKLRLYVDKMVNLAGCDMVFGVSSLDMMNGIDLDGLRKRRPSLSEDALEVLCVASFASWHGVDRFMKGLGEYGRSKSSRKIVLHLVGDGDARTMRQLRAMVKEFGLEEVVVFHGLCDRRAMDAIFDRCTLAIEVLGGHRKGNMPSSSLKSREYLGKGIPFIYSGKVDVLEREPVDFCLKVPADDSPVKMEEVIGFHDGLYGRESEEHLIERIRRYAEENVSIGVAMKEVVGYIEKDHGDVDE